VLPSASTDLFPLAALEFRRRQPHAIVHVMTGPNWLMLSQLREGNIDMVVGRMAQPAQMSGLGFEQLYLEDVVLVARPGHPLALRKRPAAEIGDWPLVLPPGGALIFPVVSGYLQSLGLRDLQPVFETVSHAFGSRVVRLSDAIWFISRGVVSEDLAAGRLVEIPLRSPMLTGPVGISLSDRRPQNLERDELVRVLRETAADQGRR
ncbi:MAG: LysR substrate-binding domain-containing protein, partial [Rhodospirillales bacterium]